MVYFLSEIERKLLLYKLLPQAREVGVSEQLRGWHWYEAPLLPYFDEVKLPMYTVCSKYCPTSRDVYLNHVEGVRGKPNYKIALGKMLHGVVSDCIQSFIKQENLSFQQWTQKIRWKEIPAKPQQMLPPAEKVWNYITKLCQAKLADIAARQPYATKQDQIMSAAPFLVEHKISGELLGLSGLLSLDCYDYLHNIIYDLKVAAEPTEWHKLAPTGYALVFESIHEVPVDIGCIVYLNIKGEKIRVKRNLFFISDELRQWWIEERDSKLEIVAQGEDPGKPSKNQCPKDCIYRHTCYGGN